MTILEHMPPNHRHQAKFNGFDGRRYSDWANKIRKNTRDVIDRLLKQQAVEEQAYRSCMGILQMSQTYGNDRLEAACAMALGDYFIVSVPPVRSKDTFNSQKDTRSTVLDTAPVRCLRWEAPQGRDQNFFAGLECVSVYSPASGRIRREPWPDTGEYTF